jgi:glyoxylase I family protein
MKRRSALALSAAVAPLSALLYAERYQAARRGYQDLAAQAGLRAVLTALTTHAMEHDELTSDRDALDALGFELPQMHEGDRPDASGDVFVAPHGGGIVLSVQSKSGFAFYLLRSADLRGDWFIGYARDAQCRSAYEQAYSRTRWKQPLSHWQRYRRDRRLDRDPKMLEIRARFRAQHAVRCALMGDIHHLGLTVSDVDASAEWYERVLGFERVGAYTAPDGGRRKVFLRHRGLRARVGLTEHVDGAKEPFAETRAGLDHLAFGIATREELEEWTQRFAAHGVVFSPVAASNTIAGAAVVVFRDPDNIQLELFYDPTVRT